MAGPISSPVFCKANGDANAGGGLRRVVSARCSEQREGLFDAVEGA